MDNRRKITDLVFATVVRMYPTPAVEQKLSPLASLEKDLGLSRHEIVMLGLDIEKQYQRTGELQHIPDAALMEWQTCIDIINTISHLLN